MPRSREGKTAINRRALLAAATLPLAMPALAQDGFPSRPIRLVVGFVPGGATDISARAMAPKMSEVLGQPVVVENRPGAGSNLASEIVARSPADGHTILLATLGALVISPMIMRLPIEPARDLVPISIAVELFNILVCPSDRPWRSAADVIAAAKARPGQLSWGHSGIGSAPQLAGLLFAKMAGIDTIGVSYRGGGLVVTDLVAGRLDYGFPTAPSVLPQVQEGRVRALAVPTAQRSRLLPDIPTVAESGLPGYDVPSWYGLVAPAGTPQPVIARLNHAAVTALRDPGVIEALNRAGLEAMPCTQEEMARAWAAERAKWEPIIRESGIRIEG
ncbi:tripartite tricarboxylate transporter substrate binding protein [Roseomonas alkaliterrae]|uniref:Tripartite-type tricarboxylate transporter receptor subunit TctC n=1 Tax=Neoroseomonas alkaliterrae TaxID=1452450 RepID=A0A840Y3C5_9PROT|nr:tripartite tricarboxylate transporter substrate binding protein [Neoroseomonas alkaliterrae]MBB5690877.1 tripartite-type tricarboxylate transporter receptor subunit TctC [Neoroseomonas alkaliterrae]MBR0677203.1 tripartite tricarboxylate transporter substrate binding protein [Neoroseomonas alkaliterrae]